MFGDLDVLESGPLHLGFDVGFLVPVGAGGVVAGVEGVDEAGVGRGWRQVLEFVLVGSGSSCCHGLRGRGADMVETADHVGVPADGGPEGEGDVALGPQHAVALG